MKKNYLIPLFISVVVLLIALSLPKTVKFFSPSAKPILNPTGNTIATRFRTPEGYMRVQVKENSFADFLRNSKLKPDGSPVHLFDGSVKNRNVHAAVIDYDAGTRDLQQCADAVIRLRAEYFLQSQQYKKIHFNFTNGFNCEYSRWRQGYRVKVNGNKVSWVKRSSSDSSYKSFREYLDIVFTYAGTISLYHELSPAKFEEMQIGDVFIRPGSPGHAVLVADMAESKDGSKLYLLAQSYMPAQEIHILKNPLNKKISPWYKLSDHKTIVTPEWIFNSKDLRKFDK